MLRSMMQMCIKGNVEAVELYQRAFDAKLIHESKNQDGSYLHAELDAFGQILAISESHEDQVASNTSNSVFILEKGKLKRSKRQRIYGLIIV
ncbi:VOC family protein [Alkaliphilus serpentinus]|uniref:Uncharacterized protein n=1 Tax=Alkaliphilus serpentinus TaxID=1482731 RepID=A0A833MA90_9FIRM|nr:hypothetical protein [Alkaliphilus serpentinus]KAB3531595.1 hypothetical protein F8153_05320 [Alkaliphilus serpentinus]